MYLGTKSITHLRTLLIGYELARSDMGLPKTEQEQEFNCFQEWIQKKFKDESTHSWASIILLNSEDEGKALERFFELLEEFQNRNRIT
jgi:hypothetical protein